MNNRLIELAETTRPNSKKSILRTWERIKSEQARCERALDQLNETPAMKRSADWLKLYESQLMQLAQCTAATRILNRAIRRARTSIVLD